MKNLTRHLRRGDTSPERPGKVFLRYGRTRAGGWREEWVTPEKLKSFKEIQYSKAKKWNRTESGRRSQKSTREKRTAYNSRYMAKYGPEWRSRPENRLSINYRSRMRIALKHVGVKKNSKTEQTLGCTFEFFRGWIQGQFRPGMTMENYGRVWVVDHITPVAAYNLFNPEELRICFHYTNCQPLFKWENHAKNDKIPGTDKNGRFVDKIIPFNQRIANG